MTAPLFFLYLIQSGIFTTNIENGLSLNCGSPVCGLLVEARGIEPLSKKSSTFERLQFSSSMYRPSLDKRR